MRLFEPKDFSKILDMDFLHEYDESKKLEIVDNTRSYIFVNDAVTICFAYGQIVEGVYQCHIMSAPEVRGSKLWKFAAESAIRMVDNFGLKDLLGFVKKDDSLCKMFLSQVGMTKRMELEDSDVYSADKEQILKLRR